MLTTTRMNGSGAKYFVFLLPEDSPLAAFAVKDSADYKNSAYLAELIRDRKKAAEAVKAKK